MSGAAIGPRAWSAALGAVGTRFRLQGRDVATGLDCIGLILFAYAAAGVRLMAIDHYRLRGAPLAAVIDGLDESGLTRCTGPIEIGDTGLFAMGAGQWHLALLAPGAIVHADAGLRRVAWAPGTRLPQPIDRWRWIGP